MKIKIYVAHHKPGFVYKTDVYEPIQVGRAVSDVKLPMIGDDTGDNISHLNPWYCELTALYWMWKNVNDLDYIGLFHYRRFMTFKNNISRYITYNLKYCAKRAYASVCPNREFNEVHPTISVSQDKFLTIVKNDEQNFLNKIKQYDCFLPKFVRFSNKTVGERYVDDHGQELLCICLELVKKIHPGLENQLIRELDGRSLYAYNMFVMRSDLFSEYMDFQMKILSQVEKYINFDLDENKRLLGFLAERIGSAFLRKKIQQLSVKEMNVIANFV